jgi:hypothetical protein
VDASATPWRRLHFLHGFGVGLGAAALDAFGSAGPSYAPALRLSYGAAAGRGARLSFVGPGSAVDREVREPAGLVGRARVRRLLGLAEGFAVFRPGAAVQPFASLGLGLHHARAEGTGAMPLFTDGSGSALGAVFAAGGGVALRLGQRAALSFEAQLCAFAPGARVLVAGVEAARVGGATALFAGGLTAAF